MSLGSTPVAQYAGMVCFAFIVSQRYDTLQKLNCGTTLAGTAVRYEYNFIPISELPLLPLDFPQKSLEFSKKSLDLKKIEKNH